MSVTTTILTQPISTEALCDYPHVRERVCEISPTPHEIWDAFTRAFEWTLCSSESTKRADNVVTPGQDILHQAMTVLSSASARCRSEWENKPDQSDLQQSWNQLERGEKTLCSAEIQIAQIVGDKVDLAQNRCPADEPCDEVHLVLHEHFRGLLALREYRLFLTVMAGMIAWERKPGVVQWWPETVVDVVGQPLPGLRLKDEPPPPAGLNAQEETYIPLDIFVPHDRGEVGCTPLSFPVPIGLAVRVHQTAQGFERFVSTRFRYLDDEMESASYKDCKNPIALELGEFYGIANADFDNILCEMPNAYWGRDRHLHWSVVASPRRASN